MRLLLPLPVCGDKCRSQGLACYTYYDERLNDEGEEDAFEEGWGEEERKALEPVSIDDVDVDEDVMLQHPDSAANFPQRIKQAREEDGIEGLAHDKMTATYAKSGSLVEFEQIEKQI